MSSSQVVESFGLEKWMTIPAFKWLTSSPMLVKWEFRTPWGICDLVGVEMAQSRVLARISNGQKKPVGPPSRVALLQMIPDVNTGRSITIEALRAQADEPLQLLEEGLRVLCEHHFVIRRDDGSFQSLTSWAPLHNRIVAIELKLGRIDEVIAQARCHTAFATESFIGLPDERAERLANSERAGKLREAGLGLLGVNRERSTVLIPPSASPSADPVLQMHTVERFWRDCLSTGRRA